MKHFSHPHELDLWRWSNFYAQPQGLIPNNPSSFLAICSCCKLPPFDYDDPMYFCMACNFFLHFTCAQYPHLFTHPSHKNHTLTLLPTAAYPGGIFKCDACNRQDNGFSYHCSSCEYDLHVTCASRPLKIALPSHSCPLELTFTNPYDNAKGFSCDICHKIGFKEWLYRCGACEFDVHLDCTAAATPAQPVVCGGQAHPDQFLHRGISAGRVEIPVVRLGQSQPLPLNQLIDSANLTAETQFQAGNAAEPAVHARVMSPNIVYRASSGHDQLGSVGQSSLISSAIQTMFEDAPPDIGQDLVAKK